MKSKLVEGEEGEGSELPTSCAVMTPGSHPFVVPNSQSSLYSKFIMQYCKFLWVRVFNTYYINSNFIAQDNVRNFRIVMG